MTNETPEQIVKEMQDLVGNLKLSYFFTRTGLKTILNNVNNMILTPENPNPTVWMGKGDPNDPTSISYGGWPKSLTQMNLADGGTVDLLLGMQLVVFLYSLWDIDYRPRLAAAHGCGKNDIKIPMLGDLRRFRNDMVHNRAIASTKYTARCEVLKWFAEGDLIAIVGDRIHELTVAIPWDDLLAAPVSDTRGDQ